MIAGRKGDPASATRAALLVAVAPVADPPARAAARARSNVVRATGFAGDSLTNNNGDTGSGFKNFIPLLTRGRIVRGVNFSTGGLTTAEWYATFQAQVLALAAADVPGRISIMLGTNDVGRPGYDVNASRASLIQVYDLWESKGSLPIANTIPPRNDSAGANVVGYNNMVKALAAQRGYTVADHYAAVVNGSGGIDNAYLRDAGVDTVHLNSAGYEKDALAVAATYRQGSPIEAIPTAGPVLRKRNLAANGLFASSGGKYNGVPNQTDYPLNWNTNQNSPGSFITDTQAEGRWYRFSAPTAQTLHQGFHGSSSVIIPGNRYRVSCLVRLSGTEGDDFNTGGAQQRILSVEFRNAASGFAGIGTDTKFPNGVTMPRNFGGRVLQYVYEGVAPATSAFVVTNVSLAVGAVMDLAELEVTDLTAQSLT